MNLANLIGGGMLLLSVAYAAFAAIKLTRLGIPPIPRVFLVSLGIGSCISCAGVGLSILLPSEHFLSYGSAEWSVIFLGVQLFCLWGFSASMFVHFYKNSR